MYFKNNCSQNEPDIRPMMKYDLGPTGMLSMAISKTHFRKSTECQLHVIGGV